MHLHGFPFFLLLVTTCSADSSDECCKAKTVGDVSYTFSRVITENDSNFDQAASCINKCVYRNTKSGNEFCFKSGDLMVECNRMSDATMKNNSKIIAESVKTAFKKLTLELGSLKNFTTVEDKLEWAVMYMPEMPKMYNNTMDMLDAMMEKSTMEGDLPEKARSFVKDFGSDLRSVGDSMASINELIDKHLGRLKNSPEEDSTVVEFQMYALEAGKAMVKHVSKTSVGGEGGGELYFDALVAYTNSSDMTMDVLMKTRGFWSWVKNVVWDTVAGAVGGCAVGFVFGPAGCAIGAVAEGAVGGAAAGAVLATKAEIEGDGGGCFTGDALVQTIFGYKTISNLEVGDTVLTSRQGIPLFTEFLGWLDRSSEASSSMLQIRTLSGPAITLTSSHLIFSNSTPRFARELRTGDSLMQWNGFGLQDAEIVSIRSVFTSGYWAPLTTEGTLLVDGFLASCYASFSHQVSDLAFSPVKMLPRLLLDDEDSQHEDGVRPYVRMVKAAGQLAGLRKEKPATGKLGAGGLSPFPVMAKLSLNTEL